MHFEFSLPDEIWKDVVGYEGSYLVSNMGRVVSLVPQAISGWTAGHKGHEIRHYSRPPRLLKQIQHKRVSGRFCVVNLCNNGRRRTFSVHSLVLTAFVGPRPQGAECCHFPDRDQTNNKLDNIRWCTRKENGADMVVHGTVKAGIAHHAAKLDDAAVKYIRREYATGERTYANLAKELDVCKATIAGVVKGRCWRHVA